MAMRKLFLALLLVFATSCGEVPTTLRVENDTPVKIFLSGSGSLGRLVIRGRRNFVKALALIIRLTGISKPMEAARVASAG